MLPDFAAMIRRYKLHRWRVARVGMRMSHIFAQHFVLDITGAKTKDAVIGRTNTVRKKWAVKLKDLAARALWFPLGRELDPYSADFDIKRFRLSFQRCLFCRPSFLYFKWKREAVFRPCNRAHFCPFCFARVSSAQYRYVKNRIRKIGRQAPDTKLIVTSRVASRFVAAPNWDPNVGCDNATVAQYERLLWGEMQRERQAYSKCQRALHRKTIGSMWRLCIVPQDTGWIIEARQLFVHEPKTKLPFVRVRGSRVTYLKSVKVVDCFDKAETDFFYALGEFNRYPQEWISGYDELVAAYLRAVYDVRLVAGTGLLKRAGRTLVQHHKRKDANAKAQKSAAQRAAAAGAGGSPPQDPARRSTVASAN
jgi:hypothetical protein